LRSPRRLAVAAIALGAVVALSACQADFSKTMTASKTASLKAGKVIYLGAPAGTFTPGDTLGYAICNGSLAFNDTVNFPANGCSATGVTSFAQPDGSATLFPFTVPSSPLTADPASTCPPSAAQVAAGTPCVAVIADVGTNTAAVIPVYYKAPAPTVTVLPKHKVTAAGSGLGCASTPAPPVVCAAGEGYHVFWQSVAGGPVNSSALFTANNDGTYTSPSIKLGAGTWRVSVQGTFTKNKSKATIVTV
jgi:hypothetical protein